MKRRYTHEGKKKSKAVLVAQIAGIVIAAGVSALCLVTLYFAGTLPSIEEISNQQIGQSTKIYDRTGQVVLFEVNNGDRRTVVPFDASRRP